MTIIMILLKEEINIYYCMDNI